MAVPEGILGKRGVINSIVDMTFFAIERGGHVIVTCPIILHRK